MHANIPMSPKPLGDGLPKEGNAFLLIEHNRRLIEVLRASSAMTPPQKEVAAALTSEAQLEALIDYASAAIKRQVVELVFIIGCFTHLFVLATDDSSRRGMRQRFFRRINVSSSQGYRCEKVWVNLGAEFVRDMKVFKAFSAAEPLKLLAAGPEGACKEALAWAREGKSITTDDARALILRHSSESPESASTESSESPRGSRSKSAWKFQTSRVHIRVVAADNNPLPEGEALVQELLAAIGSLRAN